MSMELDRDDPWVRRGYGQASIEPGERPAVLVVDLQYAFTDPAFEFGGAELIERATANTARLLETARASGVPVKIMLDREEEVTTAGNRPSATGTVRSALAKPPAPVVSCPIVPN